MGCSLARWYDESNSMLYASVCGGISGQMFVRFWCKEELKFSVWYISVWVICL